MHKISIGSSGNIARNPPFPVENGQKKRKVYLPPPHKGKLPLHKEWWRTSSEGLRDPCQPACSNRAKCWSQTLETERVRRQGRCGLFGNRKFPRPQDDSKLRQRVSHTTFGKCGTGRAATQLQRYQRLCIAGRSGSNSSSGQPLSQITARRNRVRKATFGKQN